MPPSVTVPMRLGVLTVIVASLVLQSGFESVDSLGTNVGTGITEAGREVGGGLREVGGGLKWIGVGIGLGLTAAAVGNSN